jgi:hypothetical protein
MTEVQRSTDGGSTWVDIDYDDFRISVPLSDAGVAPTARVVSQARESLTAGDLLRIREDGTTIFEGIASSGGTKRGRGQRDVSIDHYAVELFEEEVSITVTGTDEDVLNAALSDANSGGSFTLSYVGTNTLLDETYEVDNRPVKRVFRDMADRVDRVWWVDPATRTITFDDRGGRGTWNSLDAQSDGVAVRSFDSGPVDTVRNDVTVIGTGAVATIGQASDATSISTYGRRVGDSPYNVSYITTQAEADAYAASLLRPDPLAEGEIVVPAEQVGTVTEPLVNYDVDLTDAAKDISATNLTVERQVIEQGRATLDIGQGSGASLAEQNRKAKSRDDLTVPGSVYDSDRIADGAIQSDKLVDLSVTEQKLADLAVATDKLQGNAVINGKLADLSVSETKIQDDSIATPKLQAEAVTANEIEADTITAAQIAAGTITALEVATDTLTASEIAAGTITATEIAAGTITANEIAAATITANEVDVLDLDAQSLSVTESNEGFEFTVFTGNQFLPETVALEPVTDGGANIGTTSNKFQGVFDELTVDTVFVQGTSELIRPSTTGTGNVGDANFYFDEMHATNFVTQSPPSWAAADGRDVREWDVGTKDVPDFARVEPDDEAGDPGLSLGRMVSMLVGVTQAQADRIDDLEARLSALESEVGGGNA